MRSMGMGLRGSTRAAEPPGGLVPPVVYLPVRDATTTPPTVEVRTGRDGDVALLAYTALDRLLRCCGDSQPWVLVRTDGLDEVRSRQPFDAVLFDVVVPDRHRRDGRIA